MERHFDESLAALKHQLLKMSALAEAMIADAIRMLVDRNDSVEPVIRGREAEVNKLQLDIDEACLTLIALHQPAAYDLRFLLGAVKTNAELERLADQAVNITEKAVALLKEPPLKKCDIIEDMASIGREMVRDSLHAYVNRDVALARRVLLRDDELDNLKAKVTAELMEYMQRDPATVSRALSLALVARNLERIGDHATNIAENAIFVAEGRDVRHHHEEDND
jgi:phosphate transport system protein